MDFYREPGFRPELYAVRKKTTLDVATPGYEYLVERGVCKRDGFESNWGCLASCTLGSNACKKQHKIRFDEQTICIVLVNAANSPTLLGGQLQPAYPKAPNRIEYGGLELAQYPAIMEPYDSGAWSRCLPFSCTISVGCCYRTAKTSDSSSYGICAMSHI